jgi:hypothetical protein
MPKATHTTTTPTASPNAADADGELIRICAQFDHLVRALSALITRIETDELEAQVDELAPLIWATEARTMAGVQAKARSWALFSPDHGESWDGKFRASILRDLLAAEDAL